MDIRNRKPKNKIETPEERVRILESRLQGYIDRLEKVGQENADTIYILKNILKS